MGKVLDERLIAIASNYLKVIKSSTLEIQSAKRELQRLRSDITSLGAIDYSKDRISGGGTPEGLESSIAKMVDSEARCVEKTNNLIALRENARQMIDSLDCVTGKVILMQEYVNGMSFKGVVSFVGFSKSQAQLYKREALEQLGALIAD